MQDTSYFIQILTVTQDTFPNYYALIYMPTCEM